MRHAGGESVTSSRADAGSLEKVPVDQCEALEGSPALFERQFVGLDPLPRAGRVPVVKLARALRQCAREHLGRDLLEQAARHGHARGLLSAQEHETLVRELALEGVNGRA